MAQKYKVFAEEKVIYFSDEAIEQTTQLRFQQPDSFETLKKLLKKNSYNILSSKPKLAMELFFKHFKYVKAAGGIVEMDGKCLFIKRNGKWDIPKGKMEKHEKAKETAVREIQEECGLLGELLVTRKITKTYHTYFLYNSSCLKKTKWFVLSFSGEMNVTPQTEEGITEVVWVEKDQLAALLPEMYSSVRDVVACYLKP